MRVVGEMMHSGCKVTIFAWNNKYLLKLESGPYEQTFKVNEMDVTGDEDIKAILTENFMKKAIERFQDMNEALLEAMSIL